MLDIQEALQDIKVSKDIIVTTPDEIARRGDVIGWILRPALREGVVLYDCGPLEVGSNTDQEEIMYVTRRWLRQASDDLRVADLVMNSDRPLSALPVIMPSRP